MESHRQYNIRPLFSVIPMFSIPFLERQEPGYRSRYSDWLRAGRRRGRNSSPGRVKNFLFPTASRAALGPTQPPIQWVKRSGLKADHSPPAGADVKKMWIYTSTPPYMSVMRLIVPTLIVQSRWQSVFRESHVVSV
jgi:hypothetical protein